jgi:hypothetical protein
VSRMMGFAIRLVVVVALVVVVDTSEEQKEQKNPRRCCDMRVHGKSKNRASVLRRILDKFK